MKPFLAVQQFCPDTQAFEVVHQVDLDVNEPRLCLVHGFRLNAKRQVLRLGPVSYTHLMTFHSASDPETA